MLRLQHTLKYLSKCCPVKNCDLKKNHRTDGILNIATVYQQHLLTGKIRKLVAKTKNSHYNFMTSKNSAKTKVTLTKQFE